MKKTCFWILLWGAGSHTVLLFPPTTEILPRNAVMAIGAGLKVHLMAGSGYGGRCGVLDTPPMTDSVDTDDPDKRRVTLLEYNANTPGVLNTASLVLMPGGIAPKEGNQNWLGYPHSPHIRTT